MKRIWGFGREKGMSPMGSASGLQRQARGVGQKNNTTDNLLLGYHVRDRDLRKIHKAACMGNAAQVQQILFLGENGVDDRDKMNRTALHLACANGHPEVVTLLVERKCHLNLCDHENRTALMKAVQCQEEKCVNILLENGADPNIRDVSGNTALHYAAFGDNISIIEKLLLYNANTEARNKDNITPLLVAVNENKQQIVEVLVEKAANIHAEDKFKSYEIICRHKEEIMLKNSLQNSHPGADKNAEEDSIARLSDKPGPDDSWPTSSSQVLHFGTKNVPKSRIAKLLHSSWQFIKNMRPKRGTMKPEDGTLSEDKNPDSENKDMAETLSKPPVRVYGDPLPVLPSSKSLLKPSLKTLAFLGLAKSVSEKPNKFLPHVSGAVDQKGQRILNGQVEGADKNAEEDSISRLSDKPGPDDSWSTSSSQVLDFGTKSVSEKPNKFLPHVSGAVDQKGQRILNGQVEGADKNAEEDSISRLSDKPGPDDSWSTSSSQVLDFGTKGVSEKPNKFLPHVSGAVDQKGQRILNGQVEGADKNAEEDSISRLSDKPGPDDSWSTSSSQVLDFGTKGVSEKPNKFLPHVSGAVDQKGQRILNGQVEGADKNAEEDSISRLSDKPGPDDSWSTSSSQVLDFGTKSVSEKPNKFLPHVSGAVDQKGQRILNGQVEGADKNAEEDSISRLSDKPGPDDSWSTSSSQVLDFGTKEGTSKSAMEAKEDGVGIIENVTPEQAVNDSLTSAGGVHKNYRSDIMSALKLGEEEDVESPSLPEYQVPLKVEEKKKHRGSDMEVSENIHDAAAAGLIPQRQDGKTDNHQLPITENKDSDRREPGLHMKKLKKGENEKGTSKVSVITPVLQKADALTGGPLQKNDGSHFSEKDQHESRPAKKISKKKNKVKKQITSMDDLVDFIQSSETASEHCELPYSKNFMLLIEQLGMDCKDYAGFLKIQDIRVSYEKLRKLNKNHCKLLMGKMTKMDKMVSALQNELQEAKDMISRLEHQKVEWEREFCSLRCTLKQEEEEERRNADMLYENIREKLRRKEDEYKKEVETKQQVELALRMLNTELKATKNQVVEEHSDTQWQLSPEQKARVLQDGSLNNLFCKQKELEMAHKKTNSKVVARQLQQELADTLKKKSMSEASSEVTSYLRLEEETRDLKKRLAQIRSQLQEEQERHGEAVRYAEEMKDHVQKLQVKNATQEATIKHQAAQIQDLENVIKTSLLQEAQERHAEAERYAEKIKDHMLKLKVKNARQEATITRQAAQIQDLQSNLLKASLVDVLTTELETTSSKCLHLDAKNQVLQQELLSMKAFKEEREKLESNNKKLQQEVVKLKQFIEMNMVERSQVEQYKQEIEERARLDIVEKLHEVNLFLQAQAAARKDLDQLRENAHASTRNQMERRIKDLESQVSTMKTSQDSTKTELETYRQLYLEELKLRKSLRNKLNRAMERLSESNTKLLEERQQDQTLLRTLTMSPGLEPPYCGHFENNLVLNGNLTPRGNLVIPTLNPRPSYDDRETSLWKTRQELEERITRALEEAATEFE
ncbi:ankyrin repeat domain-containing protein 26-like isoform X4 [Felis catus]|uniref:ankyrin repeat domain-containing protein 26-like isoform X4 n=1 Tax=Felis catus TaxID=9685 RepID=UPI001D1A09B6|nr:ankyrin repeat domain-containing protein 26-like isoform X4 [Felis catus]